MNKKTTTILNEHMRDSKTEQHKNPEFPSTHKIAKVTPTKFLSTHKTAEVTTTAEPPL
jgi:hypothetical protein